MKVNWVGKGETVYDRVGGSEWFYQLLEFFYEDVIRRDEIRGLYPDDLTDSKKYSGFPDPILGRALFVLRETWSPQAKDETCTIRYW